MFNIINTSCIARIKKNEDTAFATDIAEIEAVEFGIDEIYKQSASCI